MQVTGEGSAQKSILDQLASLGDDEFLFLGTPPARVDLIASKRAAGRERDRRDLKKLEGG